MQRIGTVAFVQIQQQPMKIHHGGERVYRPDPLLTVEKLLLTASGIEGITADGDTLTDVHHEQHPQSRYRGDNKISFGFVQHYEAMRREFGDHMRDGIGGENIIIASDINVTQLDLHRRFIIQHGETTIELCNVIAAPPCREFSIFCRQREIAGTQLKQTLQFLSDGTRGYYAELVPADCQCMVQAGDGVFVV